MFPDNKIVALCDFETTGLEPTEDYPIEVAILFINSKLEILRSYESLIKPPDDLDIVKSIGAFMVNKIMPDMLKDAESPSVVAIEIADVCKQVARGRKDIVLCSDNSVFDHGFMRRLFQLGRWDKWPFRESYDIRLLMEATGVSWPEPAHRAMADVGKFYSMLVEARRRINS